MITALVITFIALMAIGAPIWIVLASSSLMALHVSGQIPLLVFAQRMFTSCDSFPLLAIPLFMISGNLMEGGGISKRLIAFCDSLVGWLPGGLGMVAVLTCMFFAAISGSGPATVAAIGGIMIPSMERAGYNKAFSAALMSVAGAIGVIIPPSIPMVNYGVAGSVSISSMFAAGFLPGILVGGALMLVCYFSAIKYGYGMKDRKRFSLRRVGKSLKEAFWALLMPVIILGGIYGGIFTPTEAAGVAVVYGLIVGVFVYREMNLKDLGPMLMNSAKSTGMTMTVYAAAAGFGWILTAQRIPDTIATAMMNFTDNKYIMLILINLLLLFVGCIMDTISSIIILTPIFLPIVTRFGVNPIHFGIIMVVNLAIGMSTPPLGVNLFVACGIAKVSIEDIFKQLIKFLLINIAALLIITYFEPISLIIPRLMGIA